MPSVYPPDYSTAVGQVRLLIPDLVRDTDNLYLFEDESLTALLSLYGSNVKRTAAQAKDIMAADTVMLLKVVRTDDLTVDGVKVAAELREQARQLREQADVTEAGEVFDYFNIVYPEWGVCVPEGTPYPLGLG